MSIVASAEPSTVISTEGRNPECSESAFQAAALRSRYPARGGLARRNDISAVDSCYRCERPNAGGSERVYSDGARVKGLKSRYKNCSAMPAFGGSGGTYQNFIDPSLTDCTQEYYGVTLPRLQQIKAAVDRTRVFDFHEAIPPA